jgi:DNA-binding response OmpR family regulator
MQSKQKNILIVDDDRDILEFFQLLLEMEGYDVVVTSNGEQVEHLLQKQHPDLIILDVFLSGMDGREIVRVLKKNEATRRIPVIMFSAHPGAREMALKAGADDFLFKPFEMDEALKKIAHYL